MNKSNIFYDQTGRKVKVTEPKRIVSLVPSQTELLFDMGLGDRIAGVTKFCIHPLEECREKENVGGTKKLHIDRIRSLKPDLILANKEENLKEDIDNLEKDFPVWVSDIATLDDAYEMIGEVGKMTNKHNEADRIIDGIKKEFKILTSVNKTSVLYLIWFDPLMAAGKETFIDHLLILCGFENVIKKSRYPIVDEADADIVMLSSEPFPFKEKHKKEIEKLYPNSRIIYVDGEMFSWYGSRLKYFPAYANSILREVRSSQKPG